jgi:hypothetical protein
MRRVLRHVALAAPTIDLAIISTDIFCRERVIAEHYLLQLEATKPATNIDLLSLQALHQPDDDQRGWRRLCNARREERQRDEPQFLTSSF